MTRMTWGIAAVLAAVASTGAAEGDAAKPLESEPLVAVRLLADVDQVAVGEPFHVGVHLEIADGWHIYWRHPGEAGMATQVDLALPDGWQAAPLRWPAPKTFTQPGGITGYGYADEVLLIAEVTPPETLPDDAVALSAEVRYLACADRCVQGAAAPTLTLPTGEEATPANAEVFSTWMDTLQPLAPTFALSDQDGEEHALADYRGKIVVLEWFNPDCPFIKRHHAERDTMADLHATYADEGVAWLAINSTHYMDRATTKDWHAKWEMPFDVLIDRDGAVGRAYEAKTTPHMYVINACGEIVYQGAIDDDASGSAEDPTNYVDKVLTDMTAGRPVRQDDTRPYGCSVKYAK
ncbi:MAG: redoxin domain-containing protein [Phycisphaerae bacterium]|nr:redoxin domain-containing protein [Phycisphaerae bacterium]